MPIKVSCRFCKAEFSHEAFDEQRICVDCQSVLLDTIASCNLKDENIDSSDDESEYFTLTEEEKCFEPMLDQEIEAYLAVLEQPVELSQQEVKELKEITEVAKEPKKRGRPKKAKVVEEKTKKRRGRPAGSTNKKKKEDN